jgi:hypothetical protein
MKKEIANNKIKNFLIFVILSHILICFFKIDRNVFFVQEYNHKPRQIYFEKPLPNNEFYSKTNIFDFYHFSDVLIKHNIGYISVWPSFVFLQNIYSYIQRLIKFFPVLFILIIQILHKHNICHKSSEDEELIYCFHNRLTNNTQ